MSMTIFKHFKLYTWQATPIISWYCFRSTPCFTPHPWRRPHPWGHHSIIPSLAPASCWPPSCAPRWSAPPRWSRPDESWRWGRARTRSQSSGPGSPRTGGLRPTLSAHCPPFPPLPRNTDSHTCRMTSHEHLPFEDNLVITPLQEVCQPTGPSYDHTAYLCEGGD